LTQADEGNGGHVGAMRSALCWGCLLLVEFVKRFLYRLVGRWSQEPFDSLGRRAFWSAPSGL